MFTQQKYFNLFLIFYFLILMPFLSQAASIVLTDTSNYTISANSDTVQIFGTIGANHITLQSGARAKLLNFPGNNVITIQSDSNLFTVSRSGAYVTFEGTDGTVLKMPATMSAQMIIFNDMSLDIVIDSNQVILGGQNVDDFSFDTTISFKISDTGQILSFTNTFGEDSDYTSNSPSFTKNNNGTVTDNITGLIWQDTSDTNSDGIIDTSDKIAQSAAELYCANLVLANKSDWRLPDIKAMYSLINFSGEDVSSLINDDTSNSTPFIDTRYFDFAYGNTSAGERIIDVQYATTTNYVSTTMTGNATMFGVNLADGRIKGYPTTTKTFCVQCVRSNTSYGINNFIDNNDQTISDNATGLMWEQNDSQSTMDWEAAVDYCESRTSAGYSDWRLPNAKELQSIVDYSRSPDTSDSAAINAVFNATSFTNEAGEKDWGYYWTGTTHKNINGSGDNAVYIAFGRALGYMNNQFLDVHGAGAQRSNIKTASSQLNQSYTIVTGADGSDVITHGPQGDVVRTQNCARCVRDAVSTANAQDEPLEGFNLFSSIDSKIVLLMDNDGNTVHQWNTDYRPGNAVYLLENGELLHTGNVSNTNFDSGGAGGIVQTLDWDGNVTWEYTYSGTNYLQHHDVEILPSGNILMIAWQHKSKSEAIAAGRNPAKMTDDELWPDSVIEVKPTGSDTGQIVWEWHAWDHLVQDYNSTKSNFGVVADHPELINLNQTMNGGADWNHINSVDYNTDLDQIVLSVHNFSEIWIIDHSTTTIEAAGHSGGNSGKGGDLLFRWGNPQTYGAGTVDDQKLFVQHDAEWINTGDPGEGNILIFNNGIGRSNGNYSSIEEITPPLNADGSYTLINGSEYGPDATSWTYTAQTPTDFYAKNISGQQRLSNGSTLICDGPGAHFFEVTETGETVWEYYYTGSVFRVERYTPDYSGFDDTPLDDEK